MVLVSVCPGGNFSNFLSAVAGANSALSISLTTVVTAAAFVVTPVNFMLWSSLLPSAGGAGQPLTLDPVELAMVLALIIVTPSALGVALATRKPDWTARIRRPIRLASVVILFLFVVGAIAVNGQVFLRYGGPVLGMVVAHNTLAFAAGYGLGTAARLPERDRRTVCIETGIQNSGLALVLIFGFFDGLGGMALVAACWGLWHLISGSILARYWAKRPADVEEDPSPPPALEASAA